MTGIKRSAIVNEALTWEGTPWHHHQRVKGAGVDCVQFLFAVGQSVGAIPLDTKIENYEPIARGSFLVRHLNQWLEPVVPPNKTNAQGNVLLFNMAGLETHVGILLEDVLDRPQYFIHACARRKKVVRTPLLRYWGMVKRIYQVPGVIDG